MVECSSEVGNYSVWTLLWWDLLSADLLAKKGAEHGADERVTNSYRKTSVFERYRDARGSLLQIMLLKEFRVLVLVV